MNYFEWLGARYLVKRGEKRLSRLEAKFTGGFSELEDKLSALSEKIDELQAAIDAVIERVDGKFSQLADALAVVTADLEAERQAAVELAALEDAEDVAQNAALAEAQAATDAAIAEAQAAADEISGEIERLHSVAADVAPEEPVEEPVDEPVDEPAPVDEPVEEPVEPTP